MPFTSVQLERPFKSTIVSHVSKGFLHGREVVIKKPKRQALTPGEIKILKNEISNLRILAHLNIEMIRAVCLQQPDISIMTDYESFGSLLDLLHQKDLEMDPFTSIKICQGVANGMEFLHNREIKHYNLKSSNVLVLLFFC